MRGDELKEPGGETLFTPLPIIPKRLLQYGNTNSETDDISSQLDRNGVVGSDDSGLDNEFYEKAIQSEGEK